MTLGYFLSCEEYGPDIDRHVEQLRQYVSASLDEVYVANIGPRYLDMIEAYGREVLPRLRERAK